MDLSSHAAAPAAGNAVTESGDRGECLSLLRELRTLRAALLSAEPRLVAAGPVPPPAGARNLAHYLALRRHDLRPLQERLAALGLSSLGRAEPQVLASVDRVIEVLQRLAGRPGVAAAVQAQAPADRSPLARHTEALFGPPPARRGTRIMVTLPAEAAADAGLVRALVDAGMDVARINCAHDDAPAWTAMAGHVRAAARRAGRDVRILMDLGGPKIRTGPIAPGPAVLKLRPARDALGRVTQPARLWLRAPGHTLPAEPAAAAAVEVDPGWLAGLGVGERVGLTDARGRKRRLQVETVSDGVALVQSERTLYLIPETVLRDRAGRESSIGGVPAAAGRLRLHRGQRLQLDAGGPGADAVEGKRARPARIACTLPEVFAQLRAGEPVWFDDGRIGGVIRRAGRDGAEIEITDAGDDGAWLAADKGINFPESRLDLPALTRKDLADLPVVAKLADMAALSFAQSAADVDALRGYLGALDARRLGVVLKIETRRGFERLPEMLFAAMAFPAAGVMIARGDLAVECGFERLAEVQEEILWACEAAHLPVIWATQVLENQARTGRPSRAEVTDAAMGVRADCVMLNKGPHVLAAMRTLDDILQRMQQHQAKKRSLLRALKSWAPKVVAGGG
jgi:pyruvate kinase